MIIHEIYTMDYLIDIDNDEVTVLIIHWTGSCVVDTTDPAANVQLPLLWYNN